MTILELVKQLYTLTQDYKRQVNDLPKNYVRGSEMMKLASEQMRKNYETSKNAIKEQIQAELEKVKGQALLEQEIEKTLSVPTAEEIAEGYQVVDIIAKTVDSLSPYTLENLLLKVKDLDQLLIINDVVNSKKKTELAQKVRKHAQILDKCNQKCVNTMDLIEQFEYALNTSGDSMNFTMLSLASALDEVSLNQNNNTPNLKDRLVQKEQKLMQQQISKEV